MRSPFAYHRVNANSSYRIVTVRTTFYCTQNSPHIAPALYYIRVFYVGVVGRCSYIQYAIPVKHFCIFHCYSDFMFVIHLHFRSVWFVQAGDYKTSVAAISCDHLLNVYSDKPEPFGVE